jgi:hypothetical protein
MSAGNKLLFLVSGLVGFIFFLLSVSAFQTIDMTQAPSIIGNGWLVILTLSACIVTAGFSFLICNFYGTCKDLSITHIAFYIFIFLSLIISLTCIFMIIEYGKAHPSYNTVIQDDVSTQVIKSSVSYESSDSKNITFVYIILSLSVLIFIASIIGIVIRFRK